MDKAERGLLDAILAGDHASRAIYADWLEQDGKPAAAEWIRIYDNVLARGLPLDLIQRVPELARMLDLDWRLQVARPLVEDCLSSRCPRDWGSMTATDGGAVRSCSGCDRRVHYCVDGDQACQAGTDAIVFDAIADRRWTCPPCGRNNDWMYKFCLSCGLHRPGAP